jgi:hypothetical protein
MFMRISFGGALRSGPSISSESLEAEKFQPMRVGVTTEQFGRTFTLMNSAEYTAVPGYCREKLNEPDNF